MGNFYQMAAEMNEGQIIKNDTNPLLVKKTPRGLIFVDSDGDIQRDLGFGGRVYAHGNLDEFTWSIFEQYEEISVETVVERLKKHEDVYVNSCGRKKRITRYTDLDEMSGWNDIEDLLFLTKFYKKNY